VYRHEVGSFYGAAYLSDSVLAMAARDSIYLAALIDQPHVPAPWLDPRGVNDTAIVCVTGNDAQWRIVQANRNGAFDTLLTYSGGRPRWPDYDDGLNRLPTQFRRRTRFWCWWRT